MIVFVRITKLGFNKDMNDKDRILDNILLSRNGRQIPNRRAYSQANMTCHLLIHLAWQLHVLKFTNQTV